MSTHVAYIQSFNVHVLLSAHWKKIPEFSGKVWSGSLVLNVNYCLCFFTRLEIKTQAVKFSLIFLTCKYAFVKGLSSDMNKGFSHNLEMSGVLIYNKA